MANKAKSNYDTPANTEQPERTYTDAEVKTIVAEAVKSALASYKQEHQNDQAVYRKEEYATLLYIGAIADGTVVSLGKLGQINKAGSTRDVPKKSFMEGLTFGVERMLADRSLIVVNGLTAEERD